MKKIALIITLLVLGLIYINIDLKEFLQQFKVINLKYFMFSLIFFIPQVIVTTIRWRLMTHALCPMGFWDSTRLILAGKSLNAVIPSKLGEMTKAYFLKKHSGTEVRLGMAAVVAEKLFDLGGLCIFLLLGALMTRKMAPFAGFVSIGAVLMVGMTVVLVHAPVGRAANRLLARLPFHGRWRAIFEGWADLTDLWKKAPFRFFGIWLLSALLWALHLGQIYMFFLSLNSDVPLLIIITYVPLGIFVGLLPFTLGGMGTRDSALILLFSPYESPAVMAAVGLLFSMRYWVDSLMGLPFFHRYVIGKEI